MTQDFDMYYESDEDNYNQYDYLDSEELREIRYQEHKKVLKKLCGILKKQSKKDVVIKVNMSRIKDIKDIKDDKKDKENKHECSPKKVDKIEIEPVKTAVVCWGGGASKDSKIRVDSVDIKEIMEDEKNDKTCPEWICVDNKKKNKVQIKDKPLSRDEIRMLNRKTKLCESVRNNTVCNYKNNCYFAHSINELKDKTCEFDNCRNVNRVSFDCYENVKNSRNIICGAKHLNESEENFYTRTTGIKKKATEDEMEQALLDYLEEDISDDYVNEVIINKPLTINLSKFKPHYQKFPQKFEELKKFDLKRMTSLAYLNQVQTHYFVKTNRKSLSRPKTRDMLFLDLASCIFKQYPKNKADITEYIDSLKKNQQRINDIMNKKCNNFQKEDLRKLQIGEKNKINDSIRELKSSISQGENTITRMSSANRITEVERKKIHDTEMRILENKKKLEILETDLANIQDYKKFEERYNVNSFIKVDKLIETVVKPVISIPQPTPLVKEDKEVCFLQPPHIVKEDKEVETEWIEVVINKKVKSKSSSREYVDFDKTKLCKSVTNNTKCPHGADCRYAHKKEEIIVKKCDFEPDCRNRKCLYKHEGESMDNFYRKLGFDVKKDINNDTYNDNINTKLCNSVLRGSKCVHGRSCRYAHSVKELVVKKCNYSDCYFVEKNNSFVYRNVPGCNKICNFIHEHESVSNHLSRIGL